MGRRFRGRERKEGQTVCEMPRSGRTHTPANRTDFYALTLLITIEYGGDVVACMSRPASWLSNEAVNSIISGATWRWNG